MKRLFLLISLVVLGLSLLLVGCAEAGPPVSPLPTPISPLPAPGGGGGGMGEAEVAIVQNLLMVVIQVGVPLLLTWVLAEVKRYLEQLRTSAKWRDIEAIVYAAVNAAEQLGLSEQLSEYGEDKLQVAIRFVEAQLAAAGIPLDLDEYADAIRAMIEAEVKGQFG